jgi:hypothetical protein
LIDRGFLKVYFGMGWNQETGIETWKIQMATTKGRKMKITDQKPASPTSLRMIY